MTEGDRFTFDPYKDLSASVDDAFADIAGETAFLPDLGSLHIADPDLATQPLEVTDDFIDRINNSRRWAKKLLSSYINSDESVPDLKSEVFGGVDLSKLEKMYNQMKSAGWTPEVVVSQEGLGFDEWQTRLSAVFGSHFDSGGIILSDSKFMDGWEHVSGGTGWRISVVPCGDKPPLRPVQHSIVPVVFNDLLRLVAFDTKQAIDFSDYANPQELHLSAETYLTIQALREIQMRKKLDIESKTWLQGQTNIVERSNGVPVVYSGIRAEYVFGETEHKIIFTPANNDARVAGMRPTVVGL